MALAAAPSRRFSTAPPRLKPSSSFQRHAHLRPQNSRRSPPPLLAAAAAAPLTAADTEGRKHELLRAVQETGRGSGASPDQCAAIEEAIVCVEELGAGQGAPLDLAALDGTWRLCYTSASDVLMLFEAAERLPLLQVGQIYQKFECKGRSDGGIVRNVVRWSIENLLEEQEGAALMVSAKFDVLSKRNIFLQFEDALRTHLLVTHPGNEFIKKVDYEEVRLRRTVSSKKDEYYFYLDGKHVRALVSLALIHSMLSSKERLERRRARGSVTAEKLTNVEDGVNIASCTGSSEVLPCDEGMQDMPEYN